ncbi:hypothetical protein [uncultured Jannaschia sp.]|uniref:hypothetical protein n=1 Tax=uncultured Jannaschia sp. TaxID=293347 RepID=UPI00261D4A7C|nr:hypothetical protein [uncultured Jannaschia sp.]
MRSIRGPVARVAALLVGLSLLASCGRLEGLSSGASGLFDRNGAGGLRGAPTEFGGVRYRTRMTVGTEDRRSFATATTGPGAATDAAEAGRVRAVEYCLRRFGGSDIVWSVGPDSVPVRPLRDDRGALVLRGVCITR